MGGWVQAWLFKHEQPALFLERVRRNDQRWSDQEELLGVAQ